MVIKGLEIANISISELTSEGRKITGSYKILTDKGICIAKQSFNEYSSITVPFSQETLASMKALIESIEKDINLTMGF